MHRAKIIRRIKSLKRKHPFGSMKGGRHYAAMKYLRNALFTKSRARKGVRDNRRLY